MRYRVQAGRSVLRTWLVSYFVLLAMPIAISTVVYLQAYGVVQSQINRANAEVLKQAMMAMDNRLADVRDLGISVVFNQSVNMLVQDTSLEAIRGHYYLVRQAINEIRTYNLTNWYTEDLAVYLRPSDAILTMNGMDEFDYFYGVENQRGVIYRTVVSREGWRQVLEGEHDGDYLFLGDAPSPVPAADDTRPLLYLQSLPVYRDHEKYATLFVTLNRSRFFEPLASIASLNSATGILLDRDGDVLFSTTPLAEPVPVGFADLPGASGVLSARLGSRDVTVSYVSSAVKDWKYLSIIPSSVYDERVSRIRNLIFVSIVASVIFGGLAAYLLSRRNYRPIDALVRSLGRRVGMPARGGNEYRFIQEAMDDTFGENDKMNELLKRQNVVLRSNFLGKLLKGRIEDQAFILRAMESYKLAFDSDRFGVVLFYIVDFSRLCPASGAESSEETLERARSLIAGVAEEVASRTEQGCAAEADNMLACIVGLRPADPAEGRQSLMSIARETTASVLDACGISVLAAASDVHETFFGIATAYQEAVSTMEYARALEIGDIMGYAQIKAPHGSYHYPIETEQQLINCIKAGDLEASRAIVAAVFEENFAPGALSGELTRCLLFDLAGTMVKTMSELATLADQVFLEQLDIVGRLIRCEKMGDMKRQMCDILEEVCRYIQQNRKPRKDLFIRKVIEFAEANYQDANLSVSSIAEHFQITPTYLIKLFREQTGEGVFHYVTHIRMDRATRLLADKGFSIHEVARKVGYNSTTAFIRAFKKCEGVTPGSFKELE